MVNDTIQRVRWALKNGEKPASLARRANLSPNSLYGAERDDWNPKASTLIALEPLLPPLPADQAAAA